MGSNPAGCTIFFAFFNNRKQSRKKQIQTLTNSFVRQDFFFLLNIFCDAKNGIAYFVVGCPAPLDLRSALLAHFVASLLVESRQKVPFFIMFYPPLKGGFIDGALYFFKAGIISYPDFSAVADRCLR